MIDTAALHDPARADVPADVPVDVPVGTMLDPRLLRYYLGVAEELHFGRAARRLHVAQQPLSQAIRRLEAQLGVRLFARTSRRVALTAAGRAFLADARALVRRSAEAIENARRAARGEVGALAVGYGAGELHSVLPGLVRCLRASHPGVALRLAELGAADIVAGVAAGDLDVGLVCSPVTDPTLAAEVVYREPVVLALPAAHPLAARGGPRDAVPLAAAAGEPFVLYERAAMPAAHDATVALCRAAGFGPRVAQEAGTEAAVVGLVAAGLGLAVVPASAAAAGPAGVTYRPLAEAAAAGAIELSAAWRRGDAAPLVAAFVRAAHEAARDLDDDRRTDGATSAGVSPIDPVAAAPRPPRRP